MFYSDILDSLYVNNLFKFFTYFVFCLNYYFHCYCNNSGIFLDSLILEFFSIFISSFSFYFSIHLFLVLYCLFSRFKLTCHKQLLNQIITKNFLQIILIIIIIIIMSSLVIYLLSNHQNIFEKWNNSH